MYKLYEISDRGDKKPMTYQFLIQGNRNTLGKLMDRYYNILKSQHGARARIIYAIYDINSNLVAATGPR